jgi:hypothetical protein
MTLPDLVHLASLSKPAPAVTPAPLNAQTAAAFDSVRRCGSLLQSQ